MRRRNWWYFIKGIVLIQLFLVAVIAGLTADLNNSLSESYAQISASSLLEPFSIVEISKYQAEEFFQESNLLLTGGSRLMGQLGVNQLSPRYLAENMVGSQIQVLAYAGSEDDLESIETQEKESGIANDSNQADSVPTEAIDPELFKGHRIFTYCTHSAESYLPDEGKARVDGKRGLINTVAARIERDLQNKGLQAKFINTIHDFPDYNASYAKSRLTMKKIVDSNDDISAIFDIHRDSIPGTNQAETIEIQGKKSARILIVVGTDERKPHPNWKMNYNFAQRLFTQSEKMYPGLVKGVRTKAGTYNQEFHPRALLLEFGSDYNTLEEASYAAHLFTDVLVEVLKEDIHQ